VNSIGPKGVRPPWPYEHRYEAKHASPLWLYVALEPTTGESFVLLLPRVDGACFAAFLHAFRRAAPGSAVALVLDGGGGHTSGRVSWPAGLERLPLPAYRSGNRASRPPVAPY
jgi:hypothetical protein